MMKQDRSGSSSDDEADGESSSSSSSSSAESSGDQPQRDPFCMEPAAKDLYIKTDDDFDADRDCVRFTRDSDDEEM